MILKLPNKEAEIRNVAEAISRGCDMKNVKGWWSFEVIGDFTYLNVGDGEGLTEDELKNCVETLE